VKAMVATSKDISQKKLWSNREKEKEKEDSPRGEGDQEGEGPYFEHRKIVSLVGQGRGGLSWENIS